MLALLLDENLPRTVAASLASAGFDVITVAELRARGSPDAEVLRLAVESGRVLVTRDLDFSDILRFPLGTHRGIVVLRLPNNASVEQIAHALRAICAGLLVFEGSLTPRADSEDELFTELTARELQVLRLLAEGLSNREIAERLGISEHTIKFHIASILGKLQASSRTEAVTRGVRSGLIEL